MRRLLLSALFLQFAPLGAQQPATPTSDTLVLNTGASVACRVISTDEASVKIEYMSPTDRKMQTRDVPWEDILRIDFAMDESFRTMLKATTTASLPQMLERWKTMEKLLPRRNHPAGELGLAIIRLALAQQDAGLKQTALALCGKVELDDWDTSRRDQARWLRVQLLDSLGLSADALAEARIIARDEAIQPTLAMQAHLYIATTEFAELKKLEEDNPLWLEDELVRPDRDRLFHNVLDHYLMPSLFHGALEDTATRGLWGAVQLFAFDHDLTSAAHRARDLIKLYPQSAAAKQANAFLTDNRLPLEAVEEEPEQLKPAEKADAPEPEEREPAVKRRERYTRPPAKTSK